MKIEPDCEFLMTIINRRKKKQCTFFCNDYSAYFEINKITPLVKNKIKPSQKNAKDKILSTEIIHFGRNSFENHLFVSNLVSHFDDKRTKSKSRFK